MRTPQRFLLVLTLASCAIATSSIEQTWRAPDARPGELKSVVALCPYGDGVVRRSAEDMLARKLTAHGMRVVPSYTVLPRNVIGDRTRAAVALRNAGFDGVLALRFIGREQRVDYYPDLDMYWGTGWGDLLPGTIVRVEVNAYSLDHDRLLWSAMVRSVEPDDLNELLDDVTDVISRELGSQRLIARSAQARSGIARR